MSEIVPEGWTETSIEKILSVDDLFSDGDWVESKDQDPDGNNRLIQLADIGDGRFLNRSRRFMNDEQFKRLKCTELKEGDILIARMPDPIGRATIFPNVNQKAATVVDVAILRLTSVNNYWLMSIINSSEFRREIEENSMGSTRTRIGRASLSKIKLIAPPLTEQKKIACILTSVDEVIENTQKQIDKLQDLKKATMNELLTKGIGHTEFKDSELGRIPKSWKIVTIDSVTSSIKSGLSRRLSSQDIGIPVINSGNIVSRGLDTKELKYWYLDDPQGANIENYLLQDGDILLNFINSVSQIGKSCIYKSIGRDCIYTTNLFCIRVGKKISSSFLHSLMRQEKFRKQISLITKPAVNQASFTKEDLSNLIILLPTLEEQNLIMNSLDAIDENIINHHHKLETFQSLKKSLMQDLLTGKVRVKLN